MKLGLFLSALIAPALFACPASTQNLHQKYGASWNCKFINLGVASRSVPGLSSRPLLRRAVIGRQKEKYVVGMRCLIHRLGVALCATFLLLSLQGCVTGQKEANATATPRARSDEEKAYDRGIQVWDWYKGMQAHKALACPGVQCSSASQADSVSEAAEEALKACSRLGEGPCFSVATDLDLTERAKQVTAGAGQQASAAARPTPVPLGSNATSGRGTWRPAGAGFRVDFPGPYTITASSSGGEIAKYDPDARHSFAANYSISTEAGPETADAHILAARSVAADLGTLQVIKTFAIGNSEAVYTRVALKNFPGFSRLSILTYRGKFRYGISVIIPSEEAEADEPVAWRFLKSFTFVAQ